MRRLSATAMSIALILATIAGNAAASSSLAMRLLARPSGVVEHIDTRVFADAAVRHAP